MPKPKLPPPAVDPNAVPKPKLAPAHERALAKIPERTRPRYKDACRLIEKIAHDHAQATVAAASRGDEPPQLDDELLSNVAEYATTGKL
jgi:hypothetical protein